MSETPASPIPLPEQFGPYRIVRPLGKGGMGTVYLARDTRLDRQVALKVCHLADDARALERFRREAKAAATVSHPNLCPVYEYDVRDGIAYLTMAYIDGPTLKELLAQRGPLPPGEAALLVAKMALAMQSAHDKGVVHRDLKPANIALDKKGEPIILDFGLAQQAGFSGAQLTLPGMAVGTPSYMAPEQVDDSLGTIGPNCDIYSLGVILYELLTGTMPFKGPWVALRFQVVHLMPEPPSQRNPAVDAQLEAVCLKAIAKRPAERFPDMNAFADALREAAHTSGSEGADVPESFVSEFASQWWPPPPEPTVTPQPPPTTSPQSASRAQRWTTVAVIAGLVLLPLGIALRQYKRPPARLPDDPPQPQVESERPATIIPPRWPRAFVGRLPAVVPPRTALLLTNDTVVTKTAGIRMVWIPAGTFQMGSLDTEDFHGKDEVPHRVTLTHSFYIGATLVTQQQWKAVMGVDNNPSLFRGDNLPIENVSWNGCSEFCRRLSRMEGLTFRLPTEAEWEYACRAGTTTPFHTGATISTKQANFNGIFPYREGDAKGDNLERTTEVTRYPENVWRLRDMHGNLQQWCQDWYGDYSSRDMINPRGPETGTMRVLRGGSWLLPPWKCRSARRDQNEPAIADKSYGFRVVVSGYVPKP